MTLQELVQLNLPGEPGVYLFKHGKEVLYVGKATSLRSRTRSYFSLDLSSTRGTHIVNMVAEATTIAFTQTDSVLEALILEAQLIKKLQPPYNTKDKDDKSFLFVTITENSYSRTRKTTAVKESKGQGLQLALYARGGNLWAVPRCTKFTCCVRFDTEAISL